MVQTPLPLQGVQVRSLVRKLTSCLLCSLAKKKKRKNCRIKIDYINITYAKTSPEVGSTDTEMSDTLPALKERAAE